MGKRLIQQRRGRGTLTFRSPGHRFYSDAKHQSDSTSGSVTDIIHCAGHSAPLLEVAYANGEREYAIAPEGIKVGDSFDVCSPVSSPKMPLDILSQQLGAVLSLKDIPEGTSIHNIEIHPGDGGRMVRCSGTSARIVAKTEQGITVKLPSRKERLFSPQCRAAIGAVAGSGRPEKPFLKAGVRFMKMDARNKYYPRVCGVSMNAVDHPFGSKSSHTKGRPTLSPRSAPPGRKVGKIAPRRTGRKR